MAQTDPYAEHAEPVTREPTLKEESLQTDIRQGNASASASGASAEETAVDTATKRELQPATVREAFAKARGAELATGKAEREAASESRAKRLERYDRALTTDNVLQQLAQARALVSRWSTGWGNTLLQNVPATEARALRSILGPDGPVAANNLLKRMNELKAQSASGGSGLGPLSNAEGAKLANSIASLDLGLTPEQVLNNINTIDRSYRMALAAFNYEHEGGDLDPRSDDAALAYGYIPDADRAVEGPPPSVGGATGTNNEEDVTRPANRAGLNSVVRRMVAAGRSAEEIKAYLNRVEPGLGDQTKGLEWWEKYMREPVTDPRAPRHEPEVDVETLRTQQSLPEKALGAVAETPVGAAVISSADFASGGNLDAMSSNPDALNATLKGSQYEHPDATAIGSMLGAIGQGVGLEGLAARYGLRLGPVAMGALQEGAYGYGSSEKHGVDALVDAGAAAIAGGGASKLGDLAMRGVARGVRGVTDPLVRLLHERGIPLTPGELLGGPLKEMEQRLVDMPVIGGPIRARVEEGREGFNRAAFDEALSPLEARYRRDPGIGVPGVRQSRRQVSEAFEGALQNVQLTPDDTFSRNLQNALVSIGEIDDVGPRVLRALQDRLGDELAPGRVLSGRELQGVLRKLDGVSNQFRRNEMYESSIRPRVQEVEETVRDLVARQAPDVLPRYDAARGAWRNVSVLGDAASRSRRARDGQVADQRGVFDQPTLSEASYRNTDRFGGRGASVSRRNPFEELTQAGEDIMVMPRRGTASAMALPATIGAGTAIATQALQEPATINPQTGEPVGGRDAGLSGAAGLSLAALAAAPYSRFSRNALQTMLMAPRSPGAATLGDLLLRYGPGLQSKAAVGALAPAFGQSLPETQPMADEEAMVPMPVANPEGTQPPLPEEAPAYTIEINGLRIPLSQGDWFDAKTGELVAADGTRVPLAQLGVQ